MILISIISLSVIPTEADLSIYEDTVRLHILANSDSEEDQSLKLKLRDAVISEYSKELSAFESVDGAKEELREKCDEIKEFLECKVNEEGYDYPISVRFGEEWYDTREYEDFTMPKGYYTSLIISIGKAEGKNWWCVMFPPMCVGAATENVGYSDAEELLVKKKYTVKFKLVELISELTKK